jgi:hypothetical protein
VQKKTATKESSWGTAIEKGSQWGQGASFVSRISDLRKDDATLGSGDKKGLPAKNVNFDCIFRAFAIRAQCAFFLRDTGRNKITGMFSLLWSKNLIFAPS